MHYITIPTTPNIKVRVQTKEGGVQMVLMPMPFTSFIVDTVLNDKSFGKSRATLRTCAKLEALFINAKEGDVVGVEQDTDYEMLKNATENPTDGYQPDILRQVPDYIGLVCDAPTTKPEPKAVPAVVEPTPVLPAPVPAPLQLSE